MDANWTIVIIVTAIIIIAYLLGRLHGKPQGDIPTDLIDLYKGLQELPNRVLQTIQGSINPQKGKMAELLTYAELRYDYDRIIPLGWPIDFIGIKNNQQIDFIEVKSGENHVLTDDEKHIRNLVLLGKVNFRLIKVTEEEIQHFVTSRKEDR